MHLQPAPSVHQELAVTKLSIIVPELARLVVCLAVQEWCNNKTVSSEGMLASFDLLIVRQTHLSCHFFSTSSWINELHVYFW